MFFHNTPIIGVVMLLVAAGSATGQTQNQGLLLADPAQLASQCVTCHQVFVDFKARRATGVPEIRGREVLEIVALLREFQAGERDNLLMQDIAGNLSDAEMVAVAQYYSALGRD